MAEETQAGGGAAPGASSPPNQAPGTTPSGGEKPVAGGDGELRFRPVPYARFAAVVRENRRLREEQDRRSHDDDRGRDRGTDGQRPTQRETGPAFEDDPTAYLRRENEQLRQRQDALDQKLSEAERDRLAGVLDRRLLEEMDRHPIFQSATLNAMMQEHFWMTRAAEPDAEPEDVVRAFAQEFEKEGWKPPRRSNPNRERLYGKDGTEPAPGVRTAPRLSDQERKEIASAKGVSARTLMDRLFRRTRESLTASDVEQERRLP